MIETQATLFGPLEPSSKEQRAPSPKAQKIPRGKCEPDELETTLFGIVETKAQARRRAQRIVRLIGAIEDAPGIIADYEGDIPTLEYFIERGATGILTPNDRDGLLRFVGDIEELLTEDECRDMHDNPDIWKSFPVGWPGTRPGDLYASALHAKEIAYLRELQEERRGEMSAVLAGAEEARAELAQLKAIGPLPADVAAHYSLTPMGDRLKTGAGPKHST